MEHFHLPNELIRLIHAAFIFISKLSIFIHKFLRRSQYSPLCHPLVFRILSNSLTSINSRLSSRRVIVVERESKRKGEKTRKSANLQTCDSKPIDIWTKVC